METRLREETNMSEKQFGLMPGIETTDGVLFAMRRVMAKVQLELHFVFLDLKKAYDRVSTLELWRCIRVKGVPKKCV